MAMFKFHDSNFLGVANHPDYKVATAQILKNGYGVTIDNQAKTATPCAATATDIYLVMNIIDGADVKNTDDVEFKDGDYLRLFRMQDLTGREFDMSADLITGTAPTTTNKYLVADGKGTWKAVALSGLVKDAPYFEVVKETTFGSFIVEKKKGYLVKAGFNHVTPTA